MYTWRRCQLLRPHYGSFSLGVKGARPAAGAVQDGQNINGTAIAAVGGDKRHVRDDQLARALDPARPSLFRIEAQPANRFADSDSRCRHRVRTVFDDIGPGLVEIGKSVPDLAEGAGVHVGGGRRPVAMGDTVAPYLAAVHALLGEIVARVPPTPGNPADAPYLAAIAAELADYDKGVTDRFASTKLGAA